MNNPFCPAVNKAVPCSQGYITALASKIPTTTTVLPPIENDNTMRALSKEDLKLSRENMRGAASLWKERQTLSLPPTCTQLVLCEKGKFSLDGSFSKNAPYKQKIIFHLRSIDKMSQKMFLLRILATDRASLF